MSVVLSNNATGKLSAAITDSANSISLQSGEGAKFPFLAAGKWFPVTVIKATGELEIMKCTNRSADTFTVVRAQEGTIGLSFNAGDRVSCRFTALAYAEKQNRITLLDGLLKEATAAQFRSAIGSAPVDSPEFTGYMAVPTWTTTTRPDNPDGKKMIGYNSDLKSLEGYINGKWGGIGSAGAAGALGLRNKIVDGRFDFWYEGTSQTSNGYGSDTMWFNQNVGSTKVHSQQPLVAGVDLPAIDCPSAKYFSRTVVTSVAGARNNILKITKIESVNTLAGKTATLSFYAKADAVKNIAIEFVQVFGTGGSAIIESIGSQLVGLSTAWKRYSVQVAIPSISGKTIAGGNDCLLLRFWFESGTDNAISSSSIGQQSGTFDIACVQLEEGSVATPFEELPIEVSKTRVNRYYETSYPWGTPVRFNYSSSDPKVCNVIHFNWGVMSTNQPNFTLYYRVEKRAIPAITTYNGSGAVGKIITSNDNGITPAVSYSSKQGLNIVPSGSAISYMGYHFVADARL